MSGNAGYSGGGYGYAGFSGEANVEQSGGLQMNEDGGLEGEANVEYGEANVEE